MALIKIYQKLADDIKPITPAELKLIRKFYNLSQKGFAYILNISVRTLQNYEIGRRVPPSVGTALFKLAKEHPSIFKKRILNTMREFVQ